MQLILLQDIPAIGKQHQLVDVPNTLALNVLLPQRKALVATPSVRARFSDLIAKAYQAAS